MKVIFYFSVHYSHVLGAKDFNNFSILNIIILYKLKYFNKIRTCSGLFGQLFPWQLLIKSVRRISLHCLGKVENI